MNKAIKVLLTSIILAGILFMHLNKVSATTNLYLAESKSYLYSAPSYDSEWNDVLLIGQNYEILEELASGNGCTGNWYKIQHNSNTGYVCEGEGGIQDLTYENTDENFQPTLDTFPKSYWPYLINLHELYPNVTFVPYNTNLEWDLALQKQTGCYGTSCKSLIQIRASATEEWGAQYIDNSYDPLTLSGGGCSGSYCWYKASEQVVSTYMDPRNFLNEEFIFMFESNEYDSDIQNEEGLLKLLSGTFMDSANENYETYKLDNDVLYVDAIMDAAKSTLISPYALAARIKQEVGTNGSTIISGDYSGYEGYYNYYNIGATGELDSIISNGLSYAKTNEWDSRIKAINGGASFIALNYAGTEYTQKWDVIGTDYINYSDFFTKQYMQNIQAPASQTTTIYDAYKDNSSLDLPFLFSIPVYNSMPDSETENEIAIKLAGYTYGTDYITSIKVGSNSETVINNIENSNQDLTVVIKNTDGSLNLEDETKLVTGNIISITSGEDTENYRVVLKGDVNGDGLINSIDYINVRQHIMEDKLLDSYYKIAADIDDSNSISAIDYINVRNYIMGSANLIE